MQIAAHLSDGVIATGFERQSAKSFAHHAAFCDSSTPGSLKAV